MTNKYCTLTQKHLKELVHYDPDAGLFTWKISLSNRTPVGYTCSPNSKPGYVRIRIHDNLYFAHHLAFLYMTSSFPTIEVDHIDHDTSNNAWNNIRLVTHKTNGRNQKYCKNNTSGITGVFRRSDHKKWCARIMVDNKIMHLGSFTNIKDAAKARKAAENKYGFHKNHGR